MRKCLLLIFILGLLVPHAYAVNSRLTVTTTYNTTIIKEGLFNIDGSIYLPLIPVCEALGGVVYENSTHDNYYIISRDGDVITHTVGTAFYQLNGETLPLAHPSVTKDILLVPASMLEKSLGASLCIEKNGAYITREMYTNFYNELISQLMKYCLCGDFYPENFNRYFKFYCANPSMDAGVVINSVNIGLDKTASVDAIFVPNPGAINVLVNKLNRLPENYQAENLVTVDRLYTKFSGSNYQLNGEAYYKYVDMYDAAAAQGLELKIVSSYRTEDYQKNLYNSYLRNYGKNFAEKYSAYPGYSEHQTGLAVDINSVYTTFEKSKEYAWLKEHAHEFGFIERYEKGEEYITGYAYEPWHYRYVGTDAAKIIHDQDITYEEYYAVYIYKSDYSTDKDRTWVNVVQHYYY